MVCDDDEDDNDDGDEARKEERDGDGDDGNRYKMVKSVIAGACDDAILCKIMLCDVPVVM